METSHLISQPGRSYSTFSEEGATTIHRPHTEDTYDIASEAGSYADAAPGARIWEPKQVGKLYLVTKLNTYWKEADGLASTVWRTVVYIMKFSFVFVRSLCSAYLKNKEIKKQSKELNEDDKKALATFVTLLISRDSRTESEQKTEEEIRVLEEQMIKWEEKVEAYINSQHGLSIVDKVTAWNEKLEILRTTQFLYHGKLDQLTENCFSELENTIRDRVFDKLRAMALQDLREGKIESNIDEVATALCGFSPLNGARLIESFKRQARAIASEAIDTLQTMVPSREAVAAALADHIGLASLETEIASAQKEIARLRKRLDETERGIDRAAKARNDLNNELNVLEPGTDDYTKKSGELREAANRSSYLSQGKARFVAELLSTEQTLEQLTADRESKIDDLDGVYEVATQGLFAQYEEEKERVLAICKPCLPDGQWIAAGTDTSLVFYGDEDASKFVREPTVPSYSGFTLEELQAASTKKAAEDGAATPTGSSYEGSDTSSTTPSVVVLTTTSEGGGSGDAAGAGGSPAGSPTLEDVPFTLFQ